MSLGFLDIWGQHLNFYRPIGTLWAIWSVLHFNFPGSFSWHIILGWIFLVTKVNFYLFNSALLCIETTTKLWHTSVLGNLASWLCYPPLLSPKCNDILLTKHFSLACILVFNAQFRLYNWLSGSPSSTRSITLYLSINQSIILPKWMPDSLSVSQSAYLFL